MCSLQLHLPLNTRRLTTSILQTPVTTRADQNLLAAAVKMTGFSWTALTLSLLLFAGNSFAVDQNELAKIVDAIWE
ncbi:uncharacterized protein AKAME5_002140100, partial [Lates japonicus]